MIQVELAKQSKKICFVLSKTNLNLKICSKGASENSFANLSVYSSASESTESVKDWKEKCLLKVFQG